MNSGAILGIALVIVSVLFYIVDIQNWINTVATVIVFVVGLFYLSKMYRDNEKAGTLTYGQALGFAVVTCVFAAIINTFYSYIFFTFIDPEFITKMLDKMEADMITKKVPEAQIEQIINQSKKFMTTPFMTIAAFINVVLMGTIIGLITSAFVKRDPNPFENQMV